MFFHVNIWGYYAEINWWMKWTLHSLVRWSLRKPQFDAYHVFILTYGKVIMVNMLYDHFHCMKDFHNRIMFQWFALIWKLCLHILNLKVSEKAIGYFERAALMQPDEVKWQLMIASCYRRSGNYHRALDTYKVRTRIQIILQFFIVKTYFTQQVFIKVIPFSLF